jgi:hypothetical protein
LLICTPSCLTPIRANIEVYGVLALLPLNDLTIVNKMGLRLVSIVAATGYLWWWLDLSHTTGALLGAQILLWGDVLSPATPNSEIIIIGSIHFSHL